MSTKGRDVPNYQYFGRAWDAPAWDGIDEVPVPVGHMCTNCPETVEAGDSGLVIWTVRAGEEGEPVGGYEPVHIECWLRAIRGSVEHLESRCHIGGHHGQEGPELSPRDEARATVAWLIEHERGRFRPVPWWRRWTRWFGR